MIDVQSFYRNVRDRLERTLRNNVEVFVYKNYQPIADGYERSYKLLDSIRVEIQGTNILAYFDYDSLKNARGGVWGNNISSYQHFNAWKWGEHEKSSFMYIPQFVNEGFHYNYSSTIPIIRKPYFMERTEEEIFEDIGFDLDKFFNDALGNLFGLEG